MRVAHRLGLSVFRVVLLNAVALARKVPQNDPNHSAALALLGQARLQAQEAYQRGYQLRDTSPEEARQLFTYAISLLPPEDDTYKKAQARLTELP